MKHYFLVEKKTNKKTETKLLIFPSYVLIKHFKMFKGIEPLKVKFSKS